LGITLLLTLAQQARAQNSEQEQTDKMTKSLQHTEQDLRQFLDTVKSCTKLSAVGDANKTRAAQDPAVRDCLKKNFGWSDEEIDMRYGLKPIPPPTN
ncbi:MAG TPA: hypothetical protein VH500_01830, partial [Nitrososphaeraceae archaeon]